MTQKVEILILVQIEPVGGMIQVSPMQPELVY